MMSYKALIYLAVVAFVIQVAVSKPTHPTHAKPTLECQKPDNCKGPSCACLHAHDPKPFPQKVPSSGEAGAGPRAAPQSKGIPIKIKEPVTTSSAGSGPKGLDAANACAKCVGPKCPKSCPCPDEKCHSKPIPKPI